MKSLRYLEVAAWTLGSLLVASYAGSRWWYAHSRSESVAEFDSLKNDAQQSPVGPDGTQDASTEPVDMSMWSPVRVKEYREAMRSADAPLAVLRIPDVKLVVPVFESTSEQNLNRGAGRIEGTAQLGEPGNLGIAAHRDGFFRALKDVKVGDLLVLERVTATDVYRIVSTTIVEPSDVGVLAPTTTSSITLVTCYPFYFVGSAPHRFIVHAQHVRTDRQKSRLLPDA